MVESPLPNDIASRWFSAVEEVEEWLYSLSPKPSRLTQPEVDFYKAHSFKTGWRLEVKFDDQQIVLDLLINDFFPWHTPRVAIVGRSKLLEWPHVEENNLLCILPNTTESDPDSPVDIIKYTLFEAANLIEKCLAGSNKDDFRSEFYSYWNRTVDKSTIEVRSLLKPTPMSRFIKVWSGKNFTLVADSESELTNWLDNYNPDNKLDKPTITSGALIWADSPLLPSEYPQNALDIFRIASKIKEGEALLFDLVAKDLDKFKILFGATTENGPCYWAVNILKPKGQFWGETKRGADPVTKGFRPGNVPKGILITRYLGSAEIIRSNVVRVDAEWIHGRDSDPHHTKLREKTAAIIGCGSLGSETAALLAQSGIGALILIDPEILSWANVGRHNLGARSVDKFKVTSLARKLRMDYPHIRNIVTKPEGWETIDRKLLDSCDVIISTVGSWKVEGALNEWHIQNGRKQAIIYGWLEPYGCASHAIAITNDQGCFACHLSKQGLPDFEFTKWGQSTTKHEPACGVVYQPYGPLSLMSSACLVSRLAIDCLLGEIVISTHRSWIGETKMLEESGGKWTDRAREIITIRPVGGLLHETPYNKNNGCKWCN